MKRLLATAILLVAPLAAQAGPIAWAKHHPLATKLLVATGAAGVYAEGLHLCRVVNVENCQEHYGAAWGGYGATVGLNLVGQILGQKLGGKTGNGIAYAGSAAIVGWGIYQWQGGLNKPKENGDETSKADLRSVVFVRR